MGELEDLRAAVSEWIDIIERDKSRTTGNWTGNYIGAGAMQNRMREALASAGRTEPGDDSAHCTRDARFEPSCLWCHISAEQMRRATRTSSP